MNRVITVMKWILPASGLLAATMLQATFASEVRPLMLAVPGASDLTFVDLILAFGRELIERKVGIAVGVALLMAPSSSPVSRRRHTHV